MATTSTVRRITPERQRNFGKIYDVHPVPDLTEIQTRSYERFLQADLPAEDRADAGLEGVFQRSSRSRAMTRPSSWNTSSSTWASPATSPTSAASSA